METENSPVDLDTYDYTDWKKRTAVFLVSQNISLFGSSMVNYAIVWYITLKTSSGMIMMITILTSFLPQIIISLFAGVWADRYNRKFVIMASDGMYYLLGVIGKKYDSLRYVRLSILFIGICGGVSGVLLGSFITNVHNTAVSVTASVGAAVAALLFLTLSPLLASLHYGDEWAKDSEKMEIDNEKLILFRKYRMSSREIEVCKLLLQGYTMRQISGILSLAYPTVNTYCTSIYRKININSRTELLQVFRDYANK